MYVTKKTVESQMLIVSRINQIYDFFHSIKVIRSFDIIKMVLCYAQINLFKQQVSLDNLVGIHRVTLAIISCWPCQEYVRKQKQHSSVIM